MVVGALKPSRIEAATKGGIPPATADITVRDRDIWHTFRDSKSDKLDPDWYAVLPQHLTKAQAVVLDATHPNEPAFLLFFDGGDKAGKKLVVRVNYRMKKAGIGNIVETGETGQSVRCSRHGRTRL